jgi:hypothetical protein
MVLEGDLFPRGNGDIRVFEDHSPFLRIIDALAGIRRIVLIPDAGGSLGQVDDRVCGDVESPVGAIGTRDDDGRCGRTGQKAGG